MEDAYLAVQRLQENEKTYSIDEVKRDLGL